MTMFDFLKWVFEDIFRFIGACVLMLIAGEVIADIVAALRG